MAQRGAIVLPATRRAFVGRMFNTAPTHDSHALSIGEGNMTSQIKNEKKAWSVLIVSTLAFTVCFMVWMMFGVIGIPIKKMLNLNATEFGLLTAMPVLTGSLIRVPLGIWTDRYGGRIVMTILMAITVPAICVKPSVA